MQCSISTTTVAYGLTLSSIHPCAFLRSRHEGALVQLSSLMISLRLRLRLRLRLSPAVGICTRRRIGRNFNPDAGDALGQRQPYSYSYRKHTAHRSFFPSSGSGQPHALAVVSHSSAQTAASVPAAAGTARRGP